MIRHILVASAILLLLVSVTHARDITLEWDPNTEPDIAGYKIYYKAGSPELPLDGTGAAEGPSPVDVKNNTRATLKGLDGSKIYYFAVTAYNSAGYESSFSNIVASDWIPVQTTPENGAAVSGTSVQFAWTSAPSDISVTYTLYYGTDPTLSAAAAVSPAPPAAPTLPAPPAGLAGAAALFLTLSLVLVRRRPLARATAASLLCVLLASCGGGGGSQGVTSGGLAGGDSGGSDGGAGAPGTGPFTRVVQTGTATTRTEAGFKSGTTYYWKIVANDGQKLRESTIYTFTVQ